MRTRKSIAILLAVVLSWGWAAMAAPQDGAAASRPKMAFLGVTFQNDNEALEPTTDAERGRMWALEAQFKTALSSAGVAAFADIPDAMRKQIEAGQTIGECHGCELDHARQAGASQVAWIKVQKVSNLILNMNVYVGDVKSGKLTFVHSVDIRGNTDESWRRSLTYLLDNYLLPNLTG
ncbi:MAG: DUF3280 domain-containing protein [Hyphomicrobium sp.]|jgi:hypothetical protein|nr:DUF3280 domain-containing protein [Hyphomicrobium sp.]